jgi:23S rRNA (cytidine1920-2'-O)/16S rRNA (cytidine1409-2'-O)-methyltransferase
MRLDKLLVELGLVESRTKAQALIMAGAVLVGGTVCDKAGKEFARDVSVRLKERLPFVGRGGVKLAGFLDETGFDVTGLVAMDVGSSTGGFTDCLLQRGVLRVHAVDVGKGLLDYKLRVDKRVHLLEGHNIRYLKFDEVGEYVDVVVVDLSFISLEKVLVKIKEFMAPQARLLTLVKPQFEVGKGEVGKGGVVRDPAKRIAVVDRVAAFAVKFGFECRARGTSVIKGAKGGNTEYWLSLVLAQELA